MTTPHPIAVRWFVRLACPAMVTAAVVAGAGCSTWSGFARPHDGQFRDRPEIRVGGVPVKLHLARPTQSPRPRALLFHVTGDGGWFGLDTLYFETMASNGYALAAVSARPLRARLKATGTGASPARLAEDYLSLIEQAESRLQLAPGTPVILTGLSRGASLAVVAASEPRLGRRVAGVLVMGLIAAEPSVRPSAAPFALLDRVAPPLVVLQSTVDRHVPALEARRLFGPDLPSRKLVAIEAHSHTFGGHRDELFRQVEAGLEWIASGGR